MKVVQTKRLIKSKEKVKWHGEINPEGRNRNHLCPVIIPLKIYLIVSPIKQIIVGMMSQDDSPLFIVWARHFVCRRIIFLIFLLFTATQAPSAVGLGLPNTFRTDNNWPTQSQNDGELLEEGKPIEREISGGQTHFYKLSVAAGQYARVIIDQRGIDVVVKLFAPNGKLITSIDNR